MMATTGDAADQPAEASPRAAPVGPPPSSWKVGVERGDRLALGELEREPAPDEQAAEGHDERRDADVGDDEPLQAADGRAEGDARRRA